MPIGIDEAESRSFIFFLRIDNLYRLDFCVTFHSDLREAITWFLLQLAYLQMKVVAKTIGIQSARLRKCFVAAYNRNECKGPKLKWKEYISHFTISTKLLTFTLARLKFKKKRFLEIYFIHTMYVLSVSTFNVFSMDKNPWSNNDYARLN